MYAIKIFLIFGTLLSAQSSASIDEVSSFFSEFVKLSNEKENFDPVKLGAFYADEAKIIAKRADQNKNLEFTGKQLKQLFIDTKDSLKNQPNDTSTYSKITVNKISESRYRVGATRYSNLKCYSDPKYYLVVEKRGNGFQILEEFSVSQSKSNCKGNKGVPGELSNIHNAIIKQLQPMIPLKLDEETVLERIDSKGISLEFEYKLVTVAKGELEAGKFSEIMKPQLVKQSCATPAYKLAINYGGNFKYIYNDKTGQPFTTVIVDSCP